MPNPQPEPIYSPSGHLFVGRMIEQEDMRHTLRDMLQPANPDETLPAIFLLYGDGGIGKTSLSQRFEAIASKEEPFAGAFQILRVDWEEQRRRVPALQVAREQISPNTVLELFYKQATKQWGDKAFAQYQQAKKELQDHEGLAQALGRDLAALTKRKIWFKTQHKPLYITLDTYEVVEYSDIWVREMIKTAGPHCLWVISGRNNHYDVIRRDNGVVWKGYNDDFPSHCLHACSLEKLDLADMQNYFNQTVPERLLDDDNESIEFELDEYIDGFDDMDFATNAELMYRATKGNPLIMKLAAELWSKGRELSDIIGGKQQRNISNEAIIKHMLGVYLHYVEDSDLPIIYALALAQGNYDLLRSMLTPDPVGKEQFEIYFQKWSGKYPSIVLQDGWLHDTITQFIIVYLRNGLHRNSCIVKKFNERIKLFWQEKLNNIEEDCDLLEKRWDNAEWRTYVSYMLDTLFWLDEKQAWQWLIPLYIESFVYGKDDSNTFNFYGHYLRDWFLELADHWISETNVKGQERLRILKTYTTIPKFTTPAKQKILLDELYFLAQKGWLSGEKESERLAILEWQYSIYLIRIGEFQKALSFLNYAEFGLPVGGVCLAEKVGQAMYQIVESLLWPDGRLGQIKKEYLVEGGRILSKIAKWLPKNHHVWTDLGQVLQHQNKTQEAVDAYLRAFSLTFPSVEFYNNFGAIFYNLGYLEISIFVYQQIISLEPEGGMWHITLAGLHRQLGQEAEYQRHTEIARGLIAKENEYNRACFEAIVGNHEEALALLAQALAKAPGNRLWAQQDPDLASLRQDPRFQALVHGS
ncbi:MAG: ATP-binding protein [Chloroflexi bacterium]|nr:ATP-binding protein [Chloroflexota bacterium]